MTNFFEGMLDQPGFSPEEDDEENVLASQQTPDPFRGMLDGMRDAERKAALRTIQGSMAVSPEKAAIAKRMARDLNVHAKPFITGEMDDVLARNQHIVQQANKLLDQRPQLRKFFEDPENTALTYDDMAQLQKVAQQFEMLMQGKKAQTLGEGLANIGETAWTGFKAMPSQLAQWPVEAVAGATEFANTLKNMTPEERARIQAMTPREQAQWRSEIEGNVPEGKYSWLDSLRETNREFSEEIEALAGRTPDGALGLAQEATTATVQMLPAAVATMVTRNPSVGASILSAQVFGPEYVRGRQKGLSRQDAFAGAVFFAGLEQVTEKIPLGQLLEQGDGFLKNMLKTAGAEAIQEGLVQSIQLLYDYGVFGDEVTLGEALKQVASASVIGAGAGAQLQLTLRGPIEAYKALVGNDSQAQDFSDRVTALRDEVEKAKATARDPETMRQALVAMESEDEAATVYVAAEDIIELQQSGVLTSADVEALAPGQDIVENAGRGADLEVRVADLTIMEDRAKFDALGQVVRQSIGAPSAKEAQKQLAERETLIQNILERMDADQDADPTVTPIADTVAYNLRQAGVYNEAEIERMAAMVEENYKSLAADMEGVSAAQLFLEDFMPLQPGEIPQVVRGPQDRTRAQATVSFEQVEGFLNRLSPEAQANLKERLGMSFKDVIARVPELVQGIQDFQEGKITRDEWNRIVDTYKPVAPFEEVFTPEPEDKMRDALHENKREKLNAPIEDGEFVGLRLDIPAYRDTGTWVATIHTAKRGGSSFAAGSPLSYRASAAVVAPEGGKVTLGVVEKGAVRFATQAKKPSGEKFNKETFATVRGDFVHRTDEENYALAQAALNDPAWVQVGMDPERHSYFYDRSDPNRPIIEADEIIQIGPQMLAKNPVYAPQEDFLYQDDALVGDGEPAEIGDEGKREIIASIPDAEGNFVEFDHIDQISLSEEVPELELKDLVGKKLFPIIADRTAAGVLYKGIRGAMLKLAVPLLGGEGFSIRNDNMLAKAIWANRGANVASTFAKRAEQGAEYALIVQGDPDMHQSNTTVAYSYMQTVMAAVADPMHEMTHDDEANVKEFINKWSSKNPIDKDLIKRMNAKLPAKLKPNPKTGIVAKGKQDKYDKAVRKKAMAKKDYEDAVKARKELDAYPGISDPVKANEYFHKMSFEGRKQLLVVLGAKELQQFHMPPKQAVLDEIRDKNLSGMNWGDGTLVIKIDTEKPLVKLGTEGTTVHPDYPNGVRGEVVGRLKTPINYTTLWQDWVFQKFEEGSEPAGIRRAFDLSNPVVEVTDKLVEKIGDWSAPGIPTPMHGRIVSALLGGQRNDTATAVTQGGASPQAFLDELHVSQNPNIDQKMYGDKSAFQKRKDVTAYRLGLAADDKWQPRVYYAIEERGDDRHMSVIVNNEKGTEGLSEVVAILDGLANNGVTTVQASETDVHYPFLLDIGFEQDGDVLRWKGDTDDRATLVRRYLEGGPALIRPGGTSENVDAAVASGFAESGDAVEDGGEPDAQRDAAAPAEPADDKFEPGVRGAALTLKTMSADAYENMGLMPLFNVNPQAWLASPSAVEQHIQDNDFIVGVLGGFPKYLKNVAKFIIGQRDALQEGKIKLRDVVKAYAITVGSQRAGAMTVETFEQKTGMKVKPIFVDRGSIRPEEAVAMWFGTAEGKKALDEAEKGNFDPALWQGLVDMRGAWGANTLADFATRKAEYFKNGSPKVFSLQNIQELTDSINALGKRLGDGEDVLGDLQKLFPKMHRIASAKSPFFGHFLGLGEMPTIDAVELNMWLTGQADVSRLEAKEKEMLERISGSPRTVAVMRDVVLKRFKQMRIAGQIAPLGRKLKPPAKLASDAKAAQKKKYDADLAAYRKKMEEQDRIFGHVMHHWLWDRAKGIETTHAGLYEAMDLYQDGDQGGDVKGLYRQERDVYGNLRNVVVLTENADRSTFLHEMGHFWLHQLHGRLNDPRLTAQGRARRQRMMDTTKKWFRRNATDAWRDIQKIAASAEERAQADPGNPSFRNRADRLKAAVAYAKERGGAKYMERVADGFMDGGLEFGTELEVGFHEYWARGIESYLGEGKAPSGALREAFTSFVVWMSRIYKNLGNLNVRLDDDIRGVFDRVLATDEAIQEEQNRSLYKIPQDLVSELTDKERQELDRAVKDAELEAQQQMLEKVANEIKRERGAEYQDAKVRVTAEVTAEIEDQPLYKALEIMRTGGKWNDGPVGLDRDEVIAAYDKETARRMPRGSFASKDNPRLDLSLMSTAAGYATQDDMINEMTEPFLPKAEAIKREVERRMSEQFGELVDPDVIADAAADVVQNEKQVELMALQARIVRRLARASLEKQAQRKAEQEGAPAAAVDQAAVQQAEIDEAADQEFAPGAEEAVPAQLRTAAARAQHRANIGQRRAQSAAVRQVRAMTRSMDMKAIKEAAKRYVERMRYRDMTAGKFRQTADRLANRAQVAIAARKYDEAADLLQQRAMNIEIARQVQAKADKLNKQIQRVKNLIKRADKKLSRTHDMDVIATLRLVMDDFGVANVRDAADALQTVIDNVTDERKAELKLLFQGMEAELPRYRREADGKAPYTAMPVSELEALIQQAISIMTQARGTNSIMIDGQEVNVDEIAEEVRQATYDLEAGKGERTSLGGPLKRWVTGGSRSIKAWMLRVEQWARAADGGDDGPLQKYLTRPVRAAITNYQRERLPVMKQMLDMILESGENYNKVINIKAPELDGFTFRTKGQILHFILHMGNASNQRKLLLGGATIDGRDFQWTPSTRKDDVVDTRQATAFLNRMFDEGVITKADMDLAQNIWNLFEQTKGPAQKAHRSMHGRYFDEVQGHPVDTPWGPYQGGYVPAITDRLQNPEGSKKDAEAALESAQSAAMFPGAEDGFTKGRVDYNQPLALDLASIPLHLDRVMRFSYLGPAVHAAARLINNRKFRAAVGRFDNYVIDEAIIPWLHRTARQTLTEPGNPEVDKFWRILNSHVGLQTMTGNIVNAAQQITGIPTAAVRVKPRYLMKNLVRFRKDGESARKYIADRSPYMATRFTNSVNDVMTQVNALLTETNGFLKARGAAQRYGYIAQQMSQNMIDPVVWLAAEEQFHNDGKWQQVHDQYLELGEEEAVKKADAAAALYADEIIRATQAPMGAEDVSRAETGTAFRRLFMKFYSYFNSMFNLNATEFKVIARDVGYKGNKPGRFFYLYLMGIAMPSIIAEAITMAAKGEFDDLDEKEDEELAYLFANLFVISQAKFVGYFVPGLGSVINFGVGQATQQFYDDRLNASPVLSITEGALVGLGRLVKDGVEYLVEGEASRDGSKMIGDALNAFGVATGLPTGWFRKPLQYFMRIEEGTADPEGVGDIVQGFLTGRDGTED